MTVPATDLDRIEALDDLDDDDRLIGRILTRREVLALFGAGGAAAFLAACTPGGAATSALPTSAATAGPSATALATASATAAAVASALPACVVAPELTEGPYYLDVDLERSDIRANTSDGAIVEGAPLTLEWLVSQADGSACVPMADVVVDVWHCDALGVYSGRIRQQRELPPRLPAHRHHRPSIVHDGLSRVVHGPRRTHPLQDQNGPGCLGRLRVQLAAVLR
jgi:hypothetical protein